MSRHTVDTLRSGAPLRSGAIAPTFAAWLVCALLAWGSSSVAHESLYSYVEIHLTDPHTLTIRFTVHAPEVFPDPSIDPAEAGDEWLASLDDDALATLVQRARERIATLYVVEVDRRDILTAGALSFETPEQIRNADREDAPRPGCVRASYEVPNPGGSCTVRLAGAASKRLLLVVIRPQAFPAPHDIAPGGEATVELPAPPFPGKGDSHASSPKPSATVVRPPIVPAPAPARSLARFP